jgi:hypothetical protein
MNHRRLAGLLVLWGAAASWAGCAKNQDIQAELAKVRETTMAQMDSLRKTNEALNKQLNAMNAQVDEVTRSSELWIPQLAANMNRPDSIRVEILNEVNTRFTYLATRQKEFEGVVDTLFTARSKAISDTLAVKLVEMDKTLAQHAAFVQFVAGEQDSINRVFANRFDSRPWYQSIIGRWQDQERAKAATP